MAVAVEWFQWKEEGMTILLPFHSSVMEFYLLLVKKKKRKKKSRSPSFDTRGRERSDIALMTFFSPTNGAGFPLYLQTNSLPSHLPQKQSTCIKPENCLGTLSKANKSYRPACLDL